MSRPFLSIHPGYAVIASRLIHTSTCLPLPTFIWSTFCYSCPEVINYLLPWTRFSLAFGCSILRVRRGSLIDAPILDCGGFFHVLLLIQESNYSRPVITAQLYPFYGGIRLHSCLDKQRTPSPRSTPSRAPGTAEVPWPFAWCWPGFSGGAASWAAAWSWSRVPGEFCERRSSFNMEFHLVSEWSRSWPTPKSFHPEK